MSKPMYYYARMERLADKLADSRRSILTAIRFRQHRRYRFRNLRDGTIVGKWRHGFPKHVSTSVGGEG